MWYGYTFEAIYVVLGTVLIATVLGILIYAGTRSDSRRLIERSGFGVPMSQAAIIFSFVIGIASRNVCVGVLPKHQRP